MHPSKFIPSVLMFAITLSSIGQEPIVKTTAKPGPRASEMSQLPVARVALYKNGVGFFEHAGRVTGDQSVTIDFTTSQLNDVLQSLTAIDLNGGRIAGAGYNSTTPLEQQLRALPLALGQDPTPMEFYNSIRGARVEVHGPGGTVSGRLFNIEVKNVPSKDGPALEQRVITVIGDEGGVRTAELTPTTEVRLMDAGLHQDLTRYLQLLANNRNQGLRHLTLTDNGAGARELRVSYISEVPIWKSTYRILFSDPKDGAAATQTATLQGWSVVDNTTGADWVNVQLSLISGAPQSFIQPLSVPYYSRRAQIGMQMEAQTTPQVHQSGEMRASGDGAIAGVVTDRNGAAIPRARVTATNTSTGVAVTRETTGSGSFSVSPLAPGNYNVEVVARGFSRLLQENVQVNSLQRAGLNMKLSVGADNTTITVTDAPAMLDTTNATLGGTIENELYTNLPLSMGGAPRDPRAFQYTMPAAPPPPYSAGGLQQGMYSGSGQSNLNENYIEGIPVSNIQSQGDNSPVAKATSVDYEQAARNSLGAGANASAFDDYFEYKISEPITVRKNESAMVPILQTKIDAERVTLWGAQHAAPLRALWVTNTSKMTLDRGSFSIVEDGNFGGEGLLDPIHPAEKRLLSYAVDQAVRVTTEDRNGPARVTAITAAKGVVILHHRQTAEVTYVIRNAASEPRTVVIEHPVRQGFVLDTSESPALAKLAAAQEKVDADAKPDQKPEETTPSLYRYKVKVAAGETARLHVGEHHDSATSYRLTDSNESQLNFILSQANHSKAAGDALKPIFDARAEVAKRQEILNKANARLSELAQDEDRQRQNVTVLANADKSVRERFVRDLNLTEDQITAAKKDAVSDLAELQAATDDLADKIANLQIDEKIWEVVE